MFILLTPVVITPAKWVMNTQCTDPAGNNGLRAGLLGPLEGGRNDTSARAFPGAWWDGPRAFANVPISSSL